jgi:hypothetical protein
LGRSAMKANGLLLVALLPTVGRLGYDDLKAVPSRKGNARGDDTPRRDLFSPSAKRPRPPRPQTAEAAQKPGVASTHAHTLFERFSYDKGDDAKTIEEFKQALAGDYRLTFNEAAKDPEKFKHRISVYGEDHARIKLPSIPGGHGVAMFEHKSPERCIGKYTAHETNRCVAIDLPDMTPEDEAIRELVGAWQAVLDVIGPQAHNDVIDQLGVVPSGSLYIGKARKHVLSKMSDVFASGDRERIDTFNEKLFATAPYEAKLQQTLASRMVIRDEYMSEQSASNIRGLSAEEAAIIVVGDAHANAIYDRLAKEFPDRAVVKCNIVLSP